MYSLSQKIKDIAQTLGFDVCGICKAEPIIEEQKLHLTDWLQNKYHAEMGYMANYREQRCDPGLLVENAHSVICVALNYYPKYKQSEDNPQIAYYAYGKDYHDVMKVKLRELFAEIQLLIPTTSGRIFCDTAPILERYWAAKAGIGFIGNNSLLIIPKKGSFFFLGEIIIDTELEYDTPLKVSCGKCTLCIDHCPTKAIVKKKVIDANKCISCQTIENKGDISEEIIPKLNNRLYGCDICQQVCPWNRHAKAHDTHEFYPSDDLLNLTSEKMENLSLEEYQRIFKGSAIKRAKYSGLIRNFAALQQNQHK